VTTSKLRVGRYKHYLGAWNAPLRVRYDGRAPDEGELAALGAGETLADGAIADSPEPVLAAMTVPAKIRRELWALEWEDDAATLTPRDHDAFVAYGRRVVSFLRAAGVPLGGAGHPCEARLVAVAPGDNPAPPAVDPERSVGVTLVNVGESDVLVGSGAVTIRVPPDEGCLVSAGARPYHVVVPEGAEFGLLLELSS